MTGGDGVQLPLVTTGAELPIDPVTAAGLSILERRQLYDHLDLDRLQRQAVEEAVRRVLRGDYRRKYGGPGR